MKTRATIRDVAKKANVSLMTVSRVVNKKGNTSKATTIKVLKAIKELNYRPNITARSLAAKKSNFITIIVPDISNPFFSEMVKGAEDFARENGYNIFLGDTEGKVKLEKEYIDAAINRMTDGIILVAPRLEDNLICKINDNTPLVIVDRFINRNDILQVYIDNLKGVMSAVEYLINLNHEHIAFLSGPKDVLDSLQREKGYIMALKKHNIPINPKLMLTGDFKFESGRYAFEKFFSNYPKPTAIFASNDIMAFGLIQRAHEMNVKVPEDVSIVGFDDISLSSLVNPPLTTVRHPMLEMGIKAVELLINKLDDRLDVKINFNLENTLIVRKSTKKIK